MAAGSYRIRAHEPFHKSSYDFVLEAVNLVLESLDELRHISGQELSEGVKKLALQRYGLMARTVLEHWGIYRTEDLGRVVFAMMDEGVLTREDEDNLEDFTAVFDFEDVFERNYPWSAVR